MKLHSARLRGVGTMPRMQVRRARVSDAEAICDVVNYHAERGRMLHRNLESVYANVRAFQVAVDDGQVVGCVAVDVWWADLAEVRSLAVRPGRQGQGVGGRLLAAAVDDAFALGIRRLFTLTNEPAFFERHGFRVVDRSMLPEKVWRACLNCPKADACDEIALVRQWEEGAAAEASGAPEGRP